MFPTEIRSSAVGSSSTCARVGGILAPQVLPKCFKCVFNLKNGGVLSSQSNAKIVRAIHKLCMHFQIIEISTYSNKKYIFYGFVLEQ